VIFHLLLLNVVTKEPKKQCIILPMRYLCLYQI